MIGRASERGFWSLQPISRLKYHYLSPKFADRIGADRADYWDISLQSNIHILLLYLLKCDLLLWLVRRWLRVVGYKMRPSFPTKGFCVSWREFVLNRNFILRLVSRRNYFLCIILFLAFIMLVVCRLWLTLDPPLACVDVFCCLPWKF